MTPRQLQVLDHVRDQLSAGLEPSRREIAQDLNIPSVASVQRAVEGLIASGHLTQRDRRSRSLGLPGHTDLRAVDTAALRDELARRGEALVAIERSPRAYGRRPSCAADTCGAAVQLGHLFCRPHWFKLPLTLRDGILRAHAARDVTRYQELVAKARDIADGCGGPL